MKVVANGVSIHARPIGRAILGGMMRNVIKLVVSIHARPIGRAIGGRIYQWICPRWRFNPRPTNWSGD